MVSNQSTALLIGFNTRPLAYSLFNAGYKVYVVDFFGDLDLFPYVEDAIIITKKLGANYHLLKDHYNTYLVDFTIEMLEKHSKIDILIIGSGLDDAFEEKERLFEYINGKRPQIYSCNNSIDVARNARDFKLIYKKLKNWGYYIPECGPLVDMQSLKPSKYPFIAKKLKGSGGINVHKIETSQELSYFLKIGKAKKGNFNDWIWQEFIEGIPVSCTIIGSGDKHAIISVNRQIIGFQFVNSPLPYMYCGNIVPSGLLQGDIDQIKEISIKIAKELQLKGINGLDFVIKNHRPYFMEVNPRIPGSIRVSEEALQTNLLKYHINSFDKEKWDRVYERIIATNSTNFATKLIFFAPFDIEIDKIRKINNLKYIHDKSKPNRNILKGEPVCTLLYSDKTFTDSFFGALKIVDNIKQIIQ